MATINVREKRQVIDYLARDYDSFRQALLDLIPAKLPEWTDRSESDFGIVLIELFAYMADILSYYQDRLANEAFLTTAQERRSIIHHLRLIGYEMAPAAPATARLSLLVANSVNGQLEVRRGDQFATPSTKERESLIFEYTDEKPLVIDCLRAAADSAHKPDGQPLPGFKEIPDAIPVREGVSILEEVIGSSDGAPNQRFVLGQPHLLADSLQIKVETTPPTPPWRWRRNLIFGQRAYTADQLAALEQQGRIGSTLAFSRLAERDYSTETDEQDVTTVVFGDGQYGQIPPPGARIVASYRVGGGSAGNVGSGQITAIANSPQLQLLGAKVVNRRPASGGAERETIEQAIKFAPTVFASMQRAVTAEDYVALAKLFPGVSKARAAATNWNTITLFIAPTGSGEPPSDILKRDLLAYFEDKRMLTTFIQIESPEYVRIAISATISAVPFFRNEEVQAQAENAIRSLFDFEQVNFKQTLYLSKIYEALERLDGVQSAFVPTFDVAAERVIPAATTGNAPPSQGQIATEGRISLGDNQIPVLGELLVQVSGGV